MTREPAGFEQVARRIEIDLGAKLEVLLRAAGDERREVAYGVDRRCDERTRKLRIRDFADDSVGERHLCLVGSEDARRIEGAHECGTDVARGTRDEYSHG